MKALILTHPIGTNYGGMLQCYALQTVLKRRGYDVKIIDLKSFLPLYKRVIKKIMHFVGIFRCRDFKYLKMQNFVRQNFVLTDSFYSETKLRRYIKNNDFDVVFVGSDQVWKKEFAEKFDYAYFLNFVSDDVKKVAYAVSFGTNVWKYNEEQTKNIIKNVSSYRGFSVRENDAVEMCANNLGIEPILVLDPTLLLNSSDYLHFVSARPTNKRYIFVYWLWNKEKIIEAVSEVKDKSEYEIIELSMLEGKSFMSVEDWITHIKYAEMIITDSFHGCAFSLIFNRPVKYVTSDRVFDNRRASLFSILNIQSENLFPEKSDEEYMKINLLLDKYRKKSYSFIDNVLA